MHTQRGARRTTPAPNAENNTFTAECATSASDKQAQKLQCSTFALQSITCSMFFIALKFNAAVHTTEPSQISREQ